MSNTVDEEVHVISRIVASRLINKYRASVIAETDDLYQELWIWAARKRAKIEEWLDPSQDDEDYQRGLHALEKSMYRQGDKFCRTLKARRSGYMPRDEVFYMPGELENLLPDAWDSPAAIGSQAPEDGQRRGKTNPAEGGNRAVTMFDVQVALKKLPDEERKLLELRFRDSMEPHEIAELYGHSKAHVYRRIRNALKMMTEILGGENPW